MELHEDYVGTLLNVKCLERRIKEFRSRRTLMSDEDSRERLLAILDKDILRVEA
jgi:hypothetical protein